MEILNFLASIPLLRFLFPSLMVIISIKILYRINANIFWLRCLPMFCSATIGLYYLFITVILGYETYAGVCSFLLSTIISIIYYYMKEEVSGASSTSKDYSKIIGIIGISYMVIILVINAIFFPFSMGDFENSSMGRYVECIFVKVEEKYTSKDDIIQYISDHYKKIVEEDGDDLKKSIHVKTLLYRKAYIVEFYYNESDIRLYILSDGYIQIVRRTKSV